MGIWRTAAAIAAATPPERDRYLDLLRALAIAAVVVGHWLVAAVWIADGRLEAGRVLDLAPATHWLTWVVQVMPLFFLVGGAVNARSWRSAQAAGATWVRWAGGRGARLLRPTVVLVWFWVLLAPGALLAGIDRGLITLGARNALLPLWFLAVYLLLIALVPVLLAAHERFGLALPAALLVVAAVIDALEVSGVPHVGLLNYLVVWSVPTVLGFSLADGLLGHRAARIGLVVLGIGGLLAAVTWFGYPISMVGLADGDGPNTPSLALALLGCAQTGIALELRESLTRWLERPRAWAAVVRLNLVAMTVYLWHLTVMMLVIGLLLVSGSWWSVPPLSAAWWLSRPLWVLGLAACLIPVVVLLASVEHPSPRSAGVREHPGRPAGVRGVPGMVAATAIATAAIAQLTLGGVLGLPAIAAATGLTLAAIHTGAFHGRREVIA